MKEYIRNNTQNAEANRYLILNLIRQKGSISRCQIAEETGLSRASITKFTNSLIAENWVQEIETEIFIENTNPGRRPQPLVFNEDKGLAIGLDMGAGNFRAVLTNFGGHVLAKYTTSVSRDIDNEESVALLRTGVEKMLEAVPNKNRNRVYGIGLGVSGIIDEEKEICFFCPNLPNIKHMDYKYVIERAFNCPVYMENSSRMMAINEHRVGKCKDENDFLFIDWGVGLGGVIYSRGNVLSGVGNTAGMIGHFRIKNKGEQCYCGNQGCLETLITEKALVSRIKEIVKTNPTGEFAQYDEEQLSPIVLNEVAKKKDKDALLLLDEIATYLGMGIASTVNLLNPRIIVIGGGISGLWDLIEKQVNRNIKMRTLQWAANKMHIYVSDVGTLAGAIGAATYVVDVATKANRFRISYEQN